ncbi:MAG TPA: hypothetical protein VF517_00855 [Thermoleophilaceae bacterium]|jgi:hypothetical protein
MRRPVITATATALAMTAAAPAAAAPSLDATFSSTAPGASTSLHPTIDYESTDAAGQQRALRRHVFTFPAGTVYDSLGTEACRASAEELRADGLNACSPRSRVGDGTLRAVATRPPASAAGTLEAGLTLFNASHPKDAPNVEHALLVAITVAGQVQTAFAVPVVGHVATEQIPMTCATPGEQPPCPNGELTARSVDYTIAERAQTIDGRTHRLITTPPSCPPSGRWEFDSAREYADGTTARMGATTPCTPTAAPGTRIALRVSPRSVRRCRAQRFSFTATADGRALPGATVRFADRRAVTGADGRASIVARLCKSGLRRVTAKASGYRKGTATVRVLR